jgi:hypothetical protein
MAGDLIARAIVERDDTWKRFLPFELVWAGGCAGRTVARTTAWWQRRSDAVLALAARQREELQRRQQEKRNAPGKAGAGVKILSVKLPNLKVPTVRIPTVNISAIDALLGPGSDAVGALKRRLKNSFAADDRPIDAPEAAPAAGVDDRRPDGAKRKTGTARD